MVKMKIGQITIKRVGRKFAACISGTPQKLFDNFNKAEKEVVILRVKYGRRNYKYKKKKHGE